MSESWIHDEFSFFCMFEINAKTKREVWYKLNKPLNNHMKILTKLCNLMVFLLVILKIMFI